MLLNRYVIEYIFAEIYHYVFCTKSGREEGVGVDDGYDARRFDTGFESFN